MGAGAHEQGEIVLVGAGLDLAAPHSHPLTLADADGERDGDAQPPLLAERRLRTLIFEAGQEDHAVARRLLAVTGPERSGRRLPVASQLYASLLAVEGGSRGAERAVIEGVAQRLHCRERPTCVHVLERAAQHAIDGLLFPPLPGLL